MRYFELSEDTKPRITKTLSPSMTEIAQSQGFNVSKIWYHGTTRRFTSFRNAKEGRGVEELGSGIYLTDAGPPLTTGLVMTDSSCNVISRTVRFTTIPKN